MTDKTKMPEENKNACCWESRKSGVPCAHQEPTDKEPSQEDCACHEPHISPRIKHTKEKCFVIEPSEIFIDKHNHVWREDGTCGGAYGHDGGGKCNLRKEMIPKREEIKNHFELGTSIPKGYELRNANTQEPSQEWEVLPKWIDDFEKSVSKMFQQFPSDGFDWNKRVSPFLREIKINLEQAIQAAEQRGYERGADYKACCEVSITENDTREQAYAEIEERVDRMKNGSEMREMEGVRYTYGFHRALSDLLAFIKEKKKKPLKT